MQLVDVIVPQFQNTQKNLHTNLIVMLRGIAYFFKDKKIGQWLYVGSWKNTFFKDLHAEMCAEKISYRIFYKIIWCSKNVY